MKIVARWLACLIALTFPVSAGTAEKEARFMSYPDIHGDKIVFTYEGDLWLAGADASNPQRLTTHPGSESAAHFSPDGKWIAYTGSYDGTPDIYVIAATGGEPRRLTYLPSQATCLGWTPDSQNVVFRSNWGVGPAARDSKLYTVSLDGKLPVALPVDRGVNCSYSADGRRLFYVRKGNETYYWKRYKGGLYCDLWMADLSSDPVQYKAITDYVGKNAYPMIVGDRLFFGSDRNAEGITNLYAMNLSSSAITPVTRFTDFDVMWPSTDRQRIIFVQSGYLHVLDPGSGKVRKLSLVLPSDQWRVNSRWINPSDYIHYSTVSNDGKDLLLTARGDLFHLQISGKETRARNLTQTPGTRESYGSLSPDGRTVAFFSDTAGDYQLYTRKAEGGPWTQLTDTLDRTVYHMDWSPDGKKILFGNKDFDLFWIDVATRQLEKIEGSRFLANDEFTWEISDYAWSPDSRWIAYSLPAENRNSVIYLYDTAERKKIQLTNDFFENVNPRWDAAGGYLYFISYRNYQIAMDLFEDNHIVANPAQIMVVQLQKGLKPPFAAASAQMPVDSPPQAKEAGSGPTAAADPEAYRIDPEGIRQRVYSLPVKPGNYFHLLAGKKFVVWSAVSQFTENEYEEIYKPKGSTKWDLHIFSWKDEKESVLEEKIARAGISFNGEQMLLQQEGKFFQTSVEKAYESRKSGTQVDLSGMAYEVRPREEWTQIFEDTWRWYRDFFYDKDMHGRDWKKIGEKFRACLPDIQSREQLNWLLSEMVGELCVSHTYISGGDTSPAQFVPVVRRTGLLGADLVADPASGLYRFARILGPTPYFSQVEMPLARPDVPVHEGDFLLAINGQTLKAGDNYFRLLQVAKDEYVTVTVNDKPGAEGARTFQVKPALSERDARYARWVSDNIDKVLTSSGGKVGYMHITAMGGGGVMQFDKFWRAFRYKEGLIIDVRGNGGGWTEYFMIDKLERSQVAYNVLRGMEPYRYPNSSSRAHFVVISNEDNGSDGEAFVEHFKARKLGTVVGVPSWGALVGIVNGQTTIDNGNVEQSNNAFFGREGKWLVENHGADPDIAQDNDPASVMSGKDLQLEKAIETAMKKIKEQPWTFPERPAYPKK